MMGGTRPKWTRIVASFSAISELNVECDNQHTHQPWGRTRDAAGNEVFATSLEAEYPRRFCIALVQCVLRQLQRQNLQLLATTLFDVKDNKMFEMQTARINALHQSRKARLPPLMPDFASTAVFYVAEAADVPCALQSKIGKQLQVYTKTGELETLPAHSRFLRRTSTASPFSKGEVMVGDACFEVAFGLPWTYEAFIAKAAELGHPANFCKSVPEDIQLAIDFHAAHTAEEIAQYRLDWCKRWLHRASQLELEEKEQPKSATRQLQRSALCSQVKCCRAWGTRTWKLWNS